MGALIYDAQTGSGGLVYDAQETAASGGPVLTNPGFGQPTTTTIQAEVSTNTASGTLYAMASANPTELAATVKSFGTPVSVSAVGLQSVTLTGLAAGTTYYVHFVHNASGLDSAVRSAGPTATLGAVSIITDVFRNWAGNAFVNTVIENVIVMALNRTVLLSLPNQSTNAQGRLVLSGAGLQAGVPVMVGTWNADGTVRGLEIYTPS
jgi:hypothetical protein